MLAGAIDGAPRFVGVMLVMMFIFAISSGSAKIKSNSIKKRQEHSCEYDEIKFYNDLDEIFYVRKKSHSDKKLTEDKNLTGDKIISMEKYHFYSFRGVI